MSIAKQDELHQFVASSRACLQQLLARLQWTEQRVLQLHRPDPAALPVAQLPPSCSGDAAAHSVQLTAARLQQLLGTVQPQQLTSKTFEDLQANFSASQKLIIYEHVVQCTPRQSQSFEESANFAQLVAQTKRAHQQQRRYRKSKPTLQEEMHQLVELQMQALQQQQQQKQQQQQEQQQHQKQQQQQEQRPHQKPPAEPLQRRPSPTRRQRSPHRSISSRKHKRRSRSSSRKHKRRNRSSSRKHKRRSRSRQRHSRNRSRSRSSYRNRVRSRSRARSRRQRSHYN